MSIATVSYFYSASLRQRFTEALENALHSNRLRDEEFQWLQAVACQPVTGGTDPVRVDRLSINSSAFRPFELSAALMLSHTQTDDTYIYLYTLMTGIEVFAGRHALLAALRQRFAKGDAEALFECEKIEEDPFRAQMLAIVDHQAEHARQLAVQLKMLPSLSDASTAALSRQLRQNLPHLTIDPETHLLQIIPDSTQDADAFPIPVTLAQAAFDDICKVATGPGLQRRFLDAQGLPADEGDTGLFAKALADAAADFVHSYGLLLNDFWKGVWCDRRTRRDLAIESLRGSLRRAIYECRHQSSLSAATLDALLPFLQTAEGSLLPDAALRCSRLTVKVGDSSSHLLAGTFIVQPGTGADDPVLWFSPQHALLRFADLTAFADHFSSVQGRELLRPALALEDQPVLLLEGQLQVDLQPIPSPLFAERIDSIIAMQARNLRYVAGLACAPDERPSMLDDALDVRQLIDPRQLQFSAGRWRVAPSFNFADVWLKPPLDVAANARMSSPAGAGLAVAQQAAISDGDGEVDRSGRPSWLERTRALDLQAGRLRGLDTVLSQSAEQALQAYLCVLVDGPVRGCDIRVQWLESGPLEVAGIEPLAVPVSEGQRAISIHLASLLLEYVSGHRPRGLAPGTQILLASQPLPQHLPLDLINHILSQAAGGFTQRYVEDFHRSRVERQRHGEQSLLASRVALRLREQAMRLDFCLGKRQARLDSGTIDMVRQVLDRPVRRLRMASDRPLTEAFLLSVAAGDHPPACLCDTLVLKQLGDDSPVICWSGVLGWRRFSSSEHLQATLQRKLHGPNRARWLQLLGEQDRALLSTHLLKPSGSQVKVHLHRIEGHAIEALQQQALTRQMQDLRQLCLRAVRCRFGEDLFIRLATATEVDGPLSDTLDGVAMRINNSVFEATLPSWLTSASLDDLKLYHDLLQRYYLASNGGNDFLFGIPTMQDYARQRLIAQLSQDFRDQSLDPDQITVISRRYVTASMLGQVPSSVPAATIRHSESLTEYAINRFSSDQGAVLSVESVAQPHAIQLLKAEYLRQLVRRLDVGAGYVALLRQALRPDDANYALRNRLFLEQAPLMLLGMALPAKLQGKLSAQGYRFVSHVFDMPDGIAREPVDGIRVIISPLQLVADPGMKADRVAGVYLICQATADAGPVVLFALHHGSFVFREYASRTAVMNDLRNDASLQQLLLERLDPEVRRRYDYGGFAEPHLPFFIGGPGDVPYRAPGPVTLELAELEGNVLQSLFSDTLKLLLDTGISNSVSNHQADQQGRAFLTVLGLEQVLSLLPGKLAALVTFWQSETLFRASAVSASGRRWGEALSEFSAALGVMVTAREQAILEQAHEDEGDVAAPASDGDDSTSVFSWSGASLSAEQRARLQGLEASNVALSQMRHDDLLNLYLSKTDARPFAVVAGKVYQVRQTADQGNWIIVGADGRPGPRLMLDSNQRWQLDLDLRLRGGGVGYSKAMATEVDRSADGVLIIEASGMPDIRFRYRDRARRIVQAHLKATDYLKNCLDHLSASAPSQALAPETSRIIGDFFGVDDPDLQLLTDTENAIRALLNELMHPSLSPFTSPRFVVGSNRPGRETVTAFIIRQDVRRRVFLTEQFFDLSRYALKPEAAAQGFETAIHRRAAILLHELSHQALSTYDIAYLEVMAPYPDLLLGDTADNLNMRAHVERLQRYGLSHRSHRGDLFVLNENGRWRDIAPTDNCGFEFILQAAGTMTLDDARDVFLSDARVRSQIMLRNADSLVQLIVNLGRNTLLHE